MMKKKVSTTKKSSKDTEKVIVRIRKDSCMIYIEFKTGDLEGKWVTVSSFVKLLSKKEIASWKRIGLVLNANIDFINGSVDSIEYLDQQRQLRKSNLR